ncbi:flagellar biosynthesis protein FlhF [candidate division KSB1 bacterium 4484_188]|nr:MAG: flagellar biosynthesis protein FlhF [candidate division KSB1 bacterium 4484_188]HFE63390.1 flagellar biosynthesis protein FlhF [Caldithrix sp.]
MKIKKFTGSSFQDAFEKVKGELGENAVILNSRKVKDGGILDFINSKEVYEITAAVDEAKNTGNRASQGARVSQAYRQHANSPGGKNNGNGNGKHNGNGEMVPTLPVNRKLDEQSQELKVLHDEIKDIKNVLNQVSDFLKYSRMPALPETFKTVLKKLVDNEVHEDLAKAVTQTVYSKTNSVDYKNKTTVVNNLLSLLLRMIKVARPIEMVERSPYVIALVGPTGVGKTTTIAKIAANQKLYNRSRVALISADTYRIAAIEQLQTFANIASIPMNVVYSPEDMRDAIHKFRDYDLILIDTVGRSQKNEKHLRELNRFIEMANPDEVHLVLSLTTALKNLLDIMRRFKIMRPNRLIFTKLDEATNTGNILNVLYKHQLPVSFLTTGQVVPNDITVPRKETLANLIYQGVLN